MNRTERPWPAATFAEIPGHPRDRLAGLDDQLHHALSEAGLQDFTKREDTVVNMAIVNRTLREQVLEQLRSAILDGTFAPGARLAEVEIAAQLGVSHGTVREPLRTLHDSGLLEGSEGNGLHVRRLTGRMIAELYEVRAALAGQALASILAAPDAAYLVNQLERQLPEAPEGLTQAEPFDLDLGFHEALCRLSGNATLLTVWGSIKDLMRISVLGAPNEASSTLMAKSHHQPILDAMRTGDAERARAAFAAHMATAAKGLVPARGDTGER